MGVREAGRQSRMASLGPDLRLQFVYHLHNNAREQPFTLFPFRIHMFHLHRNIPAGGRQRGRQRGGACQRDSVWESILSIPEGASEFMGSVRVPLSSGPPGPPKRSPLQESWALWELVCTSTFSSGSESGARHVFQSIDIY